MDKIKKLFDVITRDGYYNKSFEEFQVQFQDEEYQTKVFDVVTRDGLFDKTFEEFKGMYSSPVVEEVVEKKNPNDTTLASASEDGGLGQSDTNIEVEPQDYRPDYTALASEVPGVAEAEFDNIEREKVKRGISTREQVAQDTIDNQAELDLRIQEEQKQKEQEEYRQTVESSNVFVNNEEFKLALEQTNANAINQDEDDAIPYFTSLYAKYGFIFTKSGLGDAMMVYSPYNEEPLEVDLDTFFSDESEAEKLKLFLSNNAKTPEEAIADTEMTEMNRAIKVQSMRTNARINKDGTESTVLLASGEVDGKFVVYPTLFPRDNDGTTDYGSSEYWWEEKSGMDAFNEAKKRGEVITFENEEDAQEFAEGSWKEVDTLDAERYNFFRKNGQDYDSYKKAYDRLQEVRDELFFLSDSPYKQKYLNQEEKDTFEHFYVNGVKRSDANERKQELTAEANNLRDFVQDTDLQELQEDFDVYIQKKVSKISQEAATQYKATKEAASILNDASIKNLGVSADKLVDFVPKSQQQIEIYDELMTQLSEVERYAELAVNKYNTSETWFDSKLDKGIRDDFVSNYASVTNAYEKGFATGHIGNIILENALGIRNLEDGGEVKESARLIVEYLKKGETGLQGRAEYRWHQSRGFQEGWNAFKNDPLELMASLAMNSLTMMLPYGWKLMGVGAATGTAIGAGVGATGLVTGPGGVVTTGAGALAGFSYGVRGGMAATSLAMEYTTAVMDAVRNQKFNPMDEQSMAKALQKQEVWDEGFEIGLKRGIPIAFMDFISTGMAGRMFKPGAFATVGRRMAYGISERLVFDPAMEGLGELAAQMTAGQGIDGKEIAAEMIGALGSKGPNMLINTYIDSKTKIDFELANNLTDLNYIALLDVSDKRITNWSNKMKKLGHISKEQNQRIQENIGLRREARDLMSVGDTKVVDTSKNQVADPSIEARLTVLLAARNELESTTNRRQVFSKKIKDINAEINDIVSTKSLRPLDQQTVLEGQGVPSTANTQRNKNDLREGMSKYMINGKQYTQEGFLAKLDKMSNRRLLKASIFVDNDEETGVILDEKMASLSPTEETIAAPSTSTELVIDDNGNLVEQEVEVTPEVEVEDFVEETKKFRDDQVILKEETFTVTDEEGGRVVTTVRTNLDGSLRKAETESFDADGNSLGKGRDISLADNNKVVEKGLTAEQLLTDRLVEGEVIEKTERSGTEINNPKRIAGLTTDQKQKLGIETKTETDAVQKSSTESVDAQEQTGNSQEVGEGLQVREESTQENQTEVEETEKDIIALKPLKKHKTAFDNGTLSEKETKQIIAYAIDKRLSGKKLTPFENKILAETDVETVNDIRILMEDIRTRQRQREESEQEQKDLRDFINNDTKKPDTKPTPKTKLTPKPVAKPAAKPVAKDDSKEVSEIEGEIQYLESEIADKQEEIDIEKSTTKSDIQEKKDEIAKVKKSKKSPAKKRDLIEELKEEIEQLKEDGLANIDYTIFELKEAKRELKKQEKKLAKLKSKPEPKPRKQKSKIEKQVDNARKALKFLDNEIKVVYHTDDASYRDATNEQSREQSTNGEYNPATKTIHINGTKANNKTVAHEVFHALLLRTGITNEQAKAITDKMLKAVKKTASPELIEKIEKFSSNYKSSLQSEESIAELFGLLASEYPNLDAPTQSIVKRWLDKIAKILRLKPFTDAEVIDLLNAVSAKVEAGQEITKKDVKILDNKENNKLNLQDGIQDKRRTTSRTKRKSDRTRKGSSIDIKGKTRYDVGESNRVVRDDTVVKTISLSENEAQALSEKMEGKSVVDTEFYETNDANLFHKSITESTKNNKYGASVFVYPVSEYKNSRLFLTADGKAGLAITKDGTIISVFSYEKGKGRVPQLMVEAIKEGAVSLDHYDTVLTKYYADFGFVPVAKVAWNDEFAPDGWSKETFKEFNNGEPDVVLMAYDGGNRNTIAERVGTFEDVTPKLEETPYTEDYDAGLDLQAQFNSDLKDTPQSRKQKNYIDVNKIRAKYRKGKRISKGVGVKGTKNNKTITETEDLSVAFVKKEAPKAFINNANILAQEDIVSAKKKFGEIKTKEQAQEVYDIFVREAANNLIFLTEEFNQDYKETSTLWYDGANILAQNLAKKYNVTDEQVAGIIASLSPQKDWYQNVRLAELVLIAYKENPVMTQDMVDFQQNVSNKGLDAAKGQRKMYNKSKVAYKKSRTKANATKLKESKEKLDDKLEKVNKVQEALTSLIGTKLKDADPNYQAYYVRLYTELNVTKDYNILRPDGEVMGVATKKDGTNSKVAWGSYVEIGKTTSIYNDGSQENITMTLGQMHKIRNFYNNIIDPMSVDGDVTIDTHAVAAAHLKPFSGKSKQVSNNFGTGTSNSGPKGIKGLYYAYADAYALAAKELGLLPRQVQSITWEAVRGLYTDSFKRNSKNVKLINDIWEKYSQGKITIDEARKEAIEKGEGINDPTWAESVSTRVNKSIKDNRRRSDRNVGDSVGRSDRGGVESRKQQDENFESATSNSNKSLQGIVKLGRENNIPDASIISILKENGFTNMREINEALRTKLDNLDEAPRQFENIEEGVEAGRNLFEDIRQELNNFANLDEKGNVTNKRTKSFPEIRAKAYELLQNNPVFKKQTKRIQLELLSAFDRKLGINSNPSIRQKISEARARLKDIYFGEKSILEVQRKMRMAVRSMLPQSNNFTRGAVNRLTKLITDTTEKNYPEQMAKLLKEIESKRAKMKRELLKNMIRLVEKKAKVAISPSNKRKSSGLDAIGQSYFAEVKRVLKLAISNDVDGLQVMINEINQVALEQAIEQVRINNDPNALAESKTPLTTEQRKLIDKQMAIDSFGEVVGMELEDVNSLFNEVKLTRAESIARLNNKRAERRAKVTVIRDAFEAQMAMDYKELFYADGTVKSKGALTSARKNFREQMQDNGFFGGISSFLTQFVANNKYTTNSVRRFIRTNLTHFGAINNILDRGRKGIFTKTFFDRLNQMDEESKAGVFRTEDVLDGMAKSLGVAKKNWRAWRNSIGENKISISGIVDSNAVTVADNKIKKIQSSKIRTASSKAAAIQKIKDNLKELGEDKTYEARFTPDQALRIYALSKNDVQRSKLERQGITDAKLEEIKKFIGADGVKMVDMSVDFLTNTYFEGINAVYAQNNDVNLNKIDNYFPTRTISSRESTDNMVSGDFYGIFSAENAPALKERTDTTGAIDLNLGFTEVMEEHILSMEKYKAYASGVREMNEVLKSSGIQTVLKETGLMPLFKQSLNYAINPESGPQVSNNVINKLQSRFTAYALAFKAIQVLKQATSFVQAWEDYSFKGKGQSTQLQDGVGFLYDYAVVLLNIKKNIKESQELSATFRSRIRKGIEGDLSGLVSGGRDVKTKNRKDLRGKASRGFDSAAGGFTVAGDALGVMGYKAAYNRNIKNGMKKADALDAFNEFNSTQQTRRSTEKIGLQQNTGFAQRFFTMFGSTLYLQMNKTGMSMNNILNDAIRREKIKNKDIRAVALNLSAANVLFTTAAYLPALLYGTGDDREKAFKAIRNSALGLNVLMRIPLFGGAIEAALCIAEGRYNCFPELGINPLEGLTRKIMKIYKNSDNETLDYVIPIIEVLIKAQLDSPIALAKLIGGDTSGENIMDLTGISESYRPEAFSGKEKSKKKFAPPSNSNSKSKSSSRPKTDADKKRAKRLKEFLNRGKGK